MKPMTLARSAMLAAIYAALTLAFSFISFGPFQIRLSEALTILPFFFPQAILPLYVGCLLANITGTLMGISLGILDIIIGPLATLLAAFMTSRCKQIWLAPLPPVIVNTVVIGALLTYVLTPESGAAAFPMFAGQVALGQTIACYGLGLPLLLYIKKRRGREELS